MTSADPLQPVGDALAALDLTLLSEDDLQRMDQIARNLITAVTLEWFRRDRASAPPPGPDKRSRKDRPAPPDSAAHPKTGLPR